MNSYLYHLQLNINFDNLDFYKGLMEFMGWNVIFEIDTVIGYKNKTNGDLWFVKSENLEHTNYDSIGVNHISLRVDEISNVDEIKNYLETNNTQMLFNTPKHRPEFSHKPDQTYYQIMFESPDKILFEIVYIGEIQK